MSEVRTPPPSESASASPPPDKPPGRQRCGWRRCCTPRRAAIALVAAGMLYTLLGFVGVPLAIHYLVMPRVNERLNGQATLERARFNPFTLRLELGGLDVRGDTADTVASVGRFVADLQWSSIWRTGVILDELTVEEPYGHVAIEADGQVNLTRLIKPSDQPPPPPDPDAQPLRVAVTKLSIVGGRALFTDATLPQTFRHELGPIDLTMDGLDTLPHRSNPHRFVAWTGQGEKLEWEGRFNLNPLTSSGTIGIDGIAAPHYDPYARTVANLRVAGGRLGVRLRYNIDLTRRPIVVDGAVEQYTIDDAALTPVDSDEPFLTVGRLAIRGADWDLAQRKLTVEAVELRDGDVLVQRLADGNTNWQLYLERQNAGDAADAPQAPAGEPTAAAESAETSDLAGDDPWVALTAAVSGAGGPWDVAIQRVTVANQQIRWRDATTPRPAELTLLAEALTLGPIRSSDGFRLPIEAALRVQGAAVTVRGELAPQPVAANLNVAVDQLALSGFDPYLEAYALRARLPSGHLTVAGDVTANASEDGTPRVTFQGDVRVGSFALVPEADDDPLVAWESVGLTGLDVSTGPLAIRIGGIELDRLQANYVLTEQGEPAVSSLLVGADPPDADEPVAEEPAAAEPAPPPLQAIDRITFRDVGLAFVDKSKDPDVALTLTKLHGTLEGLSADPSGQARVDLEALLQETAPMTIRGQLDPTLAQRNSDVRLTIDGMPMSAFDAFSRQYLGYAIASGALTIDYVQKIEERQLDGNFKLALDRFHLGERVDSPDATGAPVKLAFDLLRDPSDNIRLAVPIKGDLDDPQFRYGHIIVQALVNTLANVAAAPFKFIAGALGAGDRDISTVAFAPGSGALTAEAAQTLDLLAEGLQQRPALNITMAASVDPAADGVVIRQAKLMDAIRAALAARRPADDPARANPASIPVADEEYQSVIVQRYDALQSGALTAEDGGVSVDLPGPASEGPVKRVMRGGRMVIVRTTATPSQPTPAPAAPSEATAGDGEALGPSFEEMERAVLAAIAVKPEELAALAESRAAAVRDYLVQARGIAASRVQVGPAVIDGGKPQVTFEMQK